MSVSVSVMYYFEGLFILDTRITRKLLSWGVVTYFGLSETLSFLIFIYRIQAGQISNRSSHQHFDEIQICACRKLF